MRQSRENSVFVEVDRLDIVLIIILVVELGVGHMLRVILRVVVECSVMAVLCCVEAVLSAKDAVLGSVETIDRCMVGS